MNRRLVSSGSWSLVGRVSSIASVLINYRLICGRLPDPELALYVVAVGVTGLCTLVTCSGLGATLLRRLSPRNEATQPLDRSSLIGRIIVLAFLSWAGVALSLLAFVSFWPDLFRRPIFSVIALIWGWVAGRSCLTLLSEAFRGLQEFRLAALMGGLQEGPLVNLCVMICLFVLGQRVDSALYILGIHCAITSIVSLGGVFMLTKVLRATRHPELLGQIRDGANGKLSDEHSGNLSYLSLLAESSKVLVSQMAVFGLIEFEILLIGRSCTDVEVGIWGAIRRLVSLVSGPLLLINASIPSFIAELYTSKDFKRLEKLLRTASTLATPPAIIAFVVLLFCGRFVLCLFDPAFGDGKTALCILAAANIIFVGAGSAGLTLRMTNHQGFTTATTILLALGYVCVAPNIVANYGILGAALLAAGMICVRNIIATLVVRFILRIWCVPSLDFGEAKRLIDKIRAKRTGKTIK